MKINNKEITPLEQGFLCGLLSKEKLIVQKEIENGDVINVDLEEHEKHLNFIKTLQKKLWFYSESK